MKIVVSMIIAGIAAIAVPAVAAPPETRCGWLANLTPQDLWLVDSEASWTITSQGQALGPDAKGVEKVPDFDRRQFVSTGGDKGYGCACLKVETNRGAKRIVRVLSGRIRPLAQCRNDKALPPQDKW